MEKRPDTPPTSVQNDESILAQRALLSVIEDQKHTEETLRASEQRFRAMFESAPLGVALVISESGIYEDINPAFAAITGRSRPELIGQRWQSITHPDDIAPQTEGVLALKSGKLSRFSMKKRFVRKDGGIVWANLVMADTTLLGAEGGQRHVAMIEDLTETERMARVLAEEQSRFRALAEQSTVGVYTLHGGVFSYINPKGAGMLGYTVAEMIGRDAVDIVADKDRPLVRENIRQRFAGEVNALRYDFTARRKDGTERIITADSTVTKIQGHRVIIGVLHDITDRVHAENDIRDYITRIETMIGGTVNAISIMVELRDPYTSGHERRVGELSAAIAAKMGLDANVQRGLRYAGAVHDVGKLAVPADLLAKPGRLTAIEFELVKAHSTQGYEVLKGIQSPWPLAEVAHQHHERLDGSGYPRGLKADDILLEARILAVADVVESMSSHRPYRPMLGVEKALAEIEQNKGRLYDSAAVDACLAVFRNDGYSFDTPN